jgi:hypothetical protein
MGWKDGILSKSSKCRHGFLLTGSGEFEVLREVVRDVAMMGSGRHKSDMSGIGNFLHYISLSSHHNYFVEQK